MKKISLPQRTIAMLLCLVLCFSFVMMDGIFPTMAFNSSEGSTCNSRLGRQLVGADGGYYRVPDTYPILAYDANGNTSYKTVTGGTNYALMYLYTQYNVDEQWVYCLESGMTFTASNGGYSSANGSNSRFFQNLPRGDREGIMLATLYGYQMGKALPVSGINQDDYYFATQIIMWEYQQGLRSSPTSLHSNGPIPGTQYYDRIKGRSAERAYNWILGQMDQHSKIPSFASPSSTSAPTYTLKYNVSTRRYSLTLTDTNNSGVDLKATSSGTGGISVVRSGNKYTFSTNSIINNPISLQYRKDIPEEGGAMMIWGRPGYQTMCSGAEDPVQFYVRVETESVGTLSIVKKGENGVPLSGWQFNIKGNGVDKTVTTGSDGRVSIPSLYAGKYTVSEINVPDYYQHQASKTVDILPGQTSEVQFYNEFLKGGLKIVKTSENNCMTGGVMFMVTGTCDNGQTYSQTLTTDKNGVIDLSGLYIGSYTIMEIGYESGGIPSWIESESPKTVRVNADSTSTVTFYNSLERGSLTIQKQSETGKDIMNVQIRVHGISDSGKKFDQMYWTDGLGLVGIEDMLVGTYFIEEFASSANEDYYLAATQTVTVKADETATVTLYNKLKRTPLKITKESYNGKNLEGVQFLMKGTTAAGTAWEHTYITDSNGIVEVKERDADAPPIGHYTVTELETSVNKGYIVPVPKEIDVTAGDLVDLHFYNAPKMGSIKIVKKDDFAGGFVEGRTFHLTGMSDSGDTVDLTGQTNAGGILEFIEVPVGDYTLTEEDVPIFFVRPDPENVTVLYAQTNVTDITNIGKKGWLKVIKTSSDDKARVGVPFHVVGIPYAGEDYAYDEILYTDKTGEINVELLIGNYSITEVSSIVNSGYIIPPPQNFTIDYNDTAVQFFHNKKILNKITLIKRDTTDGKVIPDVLLGIYDEDGNETARGRTAADGTVTFSMIPYGLNYTVRELETPEGYLPLTKEIKFDVTEHGTSRQISFGNDRATCELKVYKSDATSHDPVQGAVFGLYRGGVLVEQATTGWDGYAVFTPRVWGGSYMILEISPAPGYQKTEQTESFGILKNDRKLEFSFLNDREFTELEIHKVDGYSGADMPGVEFGLYDQHGDQLATGTTDANGTIKFPDVVQWGTDYELRETDTQPGYLPHDAVKIIVPKGSNRIFVNVGNQRATCEIQVQKTDESTGLPLGGAEFGLFDKDGKLLEKGTTNDSGAYYFKQRVWSDKQLIIKEISAPLGYILSDDTRTFTIDRDQTTINFDFANSRRTCDITITKIDGQSKEPLEGILFGLYDAQDNLLQSGRTDNMGKLNFSGLDWGQTVYAKELEATGYVLDSVPTEIALTAESEHVEITIENKLITGNVRVTKTDTDTGSALSGVTFALFDKNAQEIARGTTSNSGVLLFENIRYGDFILRETGTIDGYILDDTPYGVQIRNDGETVEFTLTNSKIPVEAPAPDPVPDAPKTGDESPVLILLLLGGGAAILLALFFVDRHRNSKKK